MQWPSVADPVRRSASRLPHHAIPRPLPARSVIRRGLQATELPGGHAHHVVRPSHQVGVDADDAVRAEGAVPATIGVIGGVVKVGLEESELEFMATAEGIPKLSARDLPSAVAKASHGATTVAATAHLAALADIQLLATGGLGGVHREARESWDVSADLATLARTPIAVVCSGVKSILDVPATLECLETMGVSIVGFRTLRFPGFYVTDSGSPLEWAAESEEEVARTIESMWSVGLKDSGLVVANPISEDEQLDPALHERVLGTSLEELKRLGVRGKDVTPFLLDRFAAETGGESVRVNRFIILGNASLAARIAVSL